MRLGARGARARGFWAPRGSRGRRSAGRCEARGISACVAGRARLLDRLAARESCAHLHPCTHRRPLGLCDPPRSSRSGVATLPLVLPAGLPLLFVLPRLYPWMHPEIAAHLDNRFYLNAPFFYVRWLCLCDRLAGSGILGAAGSEAQRIARRSCIGSRRPGLILLALSVTFSAIDFTLSMDPHFKSSIYGMLIGCESVLLALSVAVMATGTRRAARTTPQINRDLGRLLFALLVLWAYLDFMQVLIIWNSDLPDEAAWYLMRLKGEWLTIAVLIAVCHFLLPFFALIWPQVQRSRADDGGVAALLVLIEAVRAWWIVIPAAGRGLTWVDLAAMAAVLGVGGGHRLAGCPVVRRLPSRAARPCLKPSESSRTPEHEPTDIGAGVHLGRRRRCAWARCSRARSWCSGSIPLQARPHAPDAASALSRTAAAARSRKRTCNASMRRRCRSSTARAGSIRTAGSCTFRSRRPCSEIAQEGIAGWPAAREAPHEAVLWVVAPPRRSGCRTLVGAVRPRHPTPICIPFTNDRALELPTQPVFSDSDGRTVRLSELSQGLPLIVVLAYFHCSSLCGVVRSSLFNALRRREARGRPRLRARGLEYRPSRDERRGARGEVCRSGGVRTLGGRDASCITSPVEPTIFKRSPMPWDFAIASIRPAISSCIRRAWCL